MSEAVEIRTDRSKTSLHRGMIAGVKLILDDRGRPTDVAVNVVGSSGWINVGYCQWIGANEPGATEWRSGDDVVEIYESIRAEIDGARTGLSSAGEES